ncbi:hypothetical protein D3C85_1068040 [compost metagenome]
MDVNDDAGSLAPRGALRFIASRLAPTGDRVSGEGFEGGVDLLQHLGLALLAPVQRDHLLVRLDFVDVGRQFFEMIEQRAIFTDFLPLIDPDTR